VEVAGLSVLMSYSKDLKRDVGWMEGASSVGFLVGPMLGGFLSSRLGFRTLFLIMSLPNAAMVALLTCAPQLILPRGHDSSMVDTSQHSVGASQHSVLSLSSINSHKGAGATEHPHSHPHAHPHAHPHPHSHSQPASASRRRRKAATLKRTGRAVLSSPTLPLYILIVLVVAGALGFMDTALSEHLVTALGASTFTAGILFTIQITVGGMGGCLID
jgi:MFS family permease